MDNRELTLFVRESKSVWDKPQKKFLARSAANQAQERASEVVPRQADRRLMAALNSSDLPPWLFQSRSARPGAEQRREAVPLFRSANFVPPFLEPAPKLRISWLPFRVQEGYAGCKRRSERSEGVSQSPRQIASRQASA